MLTAAIRAGVGHGSFAPDLDPRSTAYALWAAMNGVLALNWRADRLRVDTRDMDGVLDTIITVIMRGLDGRT
jgi:hypothetical protein